MPIEKVTSLCTLSITGKEGVPYDHIQKWKLEGAIIYQLSPND